MIDVIMGPIQNVNLCIAPAFFANQVDIFSPFKSYSSVNKRASMKVWFLIFCCCTTGQGGGGGVDIRVLEDYSTDSCPRVHMVRWSIWVPEICST